MNELRTEIRKMIILLMHLIELSLKQLYGAVFDKLLKKYNVKSIGLLGDKRGKFFGQLKSLWNKGLGLSDKGALFMKLSYNDNVRLHFKATINRMLK